MANSTMKRQSILVVDDEEIIRDTLSKDLQDFGYDVCIAQDGDEAIVLYKEKMHDLVLLDLVMMELGGLDVAREILKLNPDVKIIILTGYGSIESAIEALRLGVNEYFIKPCERKVILDKVKDLLDKTGLRPKTYRGALFEKLGGYKLTAREMEITKLLLTGHTRDDVSKELFISKNTVDTHIKHIYHKFDVPNFSKLLGKILA